MENNVADQTGYTLYIREPNTELHLNGGKIYGNIYKATDSLICLQKHKDPQELPNFSAAKFFLNIPKDGGIGLIDKINNYEVDSIINQIQIDNGYAEKENEMIKALPHKCNLKINFNGGIINYEINHGVFIFPNTFEGFNEDHYITQWISGGQTYQIGDKLNIVSDKEFTVNTKPYFKLTFNYGSKSELVRVTQNFKYYLPTTTPDGSRLFGFECSNGNYYAYAEPVDVTSDLTFTATFVQYFTLTIVINNDITKYSEKYGDQFSLPEPPYTSGNNVFKYWIVNNEQYQPHDLITITRDTTATAFYSDTFTMKFIVGEKEETRTCKNNEVIDLYYTGPEKSNQVSETGREFDYWIIDDKKHLLYSKYKVTKNVDIIALFAVIDKNQKIEVTFNSPVSQKSSSTMSIKNAHTMSYNYLENMTLPDGEELFGDFGVDEETSEKIYFICWDHNGVRYKKIV